MPGQLNVGQALDQEEAIAAFTTGPAKAMGLAGEIGKLVPGLSADFISPDQDLFETAPADIHATRVVGTHFEGHQVYAAGDRLPPAPGAVATESAAPAAP